MGQARLLYDPSVMFLKDDLELQNVDLELREPLAAPPRATFNQHAIATLYNRLGGLFHHLTGKTEMDPANVLAVWFVESGGAPFVPRRSVIRLEVHRLFELWGKRNRETFDNHFRFGGHNQQPGNPWENQEYRTQDSGTYSSVHHNQNSEYAALTLAQVTASNELALLCTSIGGCQLLMDNHQILGYDTAQEMYEAFQQSERNHVLGFFDYCRAKSAPRQGELLQYLKVRDWNNFAKYYNGTGQVAAYAARLKTGYENAKIMLSSPKLA